MNKRFLTGLACLGLTFALSCSSSQGTQRPQPRTGSGGDQGKGTSGTGTGSPSFGVKVTYDSWVKTYIDSKCSQCHSAGGDNPDLSSYANVKSAADQILDEMEAGSMPQGGPKPTSDQVSKMKAWIAGGKLEKEIASTATSPTTPKTSTSTGTSTQGGTTGSGSGSGGSGVGGTANNSTGGSTGSTNLTWTRDIQPIFRQSCGLGNSGCHSQGARTGDLTSQASSKRMALQISASVSSGKMPRGGSLNGADKQKIITWVNQGAN